LREQYSHWVLPESDIAKTCIAYLMLNFFNLGLCGDENSLTERLQKNPFAEYTARNWGLHVRQARVQDDLEVQQKVFQIWQSRNFHWQKYLKASHKLAPNATAITGAKRNHFQITISCAKIISPTLGMRLRNKRSKNLEGALLRASLTFLLLLPLR
jgi:hypothetical protein